MGCDSPRTGVEAWLSHAFSLQLLSLNGNNRSRVCDSPCPLQEFVTLSQFSFSFYLKVCGGEIEGGQGSGLKEEAWHWEAD